MKFDASLFVVVVIFLITYFVLKLVLFAPLLRIIKRREARIEGALEVWQRATADADAALQQERQQLLAARREAAAHRDALRKDALEQRRNLLEGAKTEAQERLQAARAELAAEVTADREALAGNARALAGKITEHLAGRAM